VEWRPTDSGVSECDCESSKTRSWPTGEGGGLRYGKKHIHKISYTDRQVVSCYTACHYVILNLEHGVLYMQRSNVCCRMP
jgi:hypothetical protein